MEDTQITKAEEDLEKLSEKLLGKIWKLMSWTGRWCMIEHYVVI